MYDTCIRRKSLLKRRALSCILSCSTLNPQPDLSWLMKDERQAKKKYTIFDLPVKKGVDTKSNQGSSIKGSSIGACVQYQSTPASRSGHTKPGTGIKPSMPVLHPPSFLSMSTAHNQPQSQQQSELPYTLPSSTADGSLTATMNHGYLQNYSQEISMPPMISPYEDPFQNANAMTMMNTMMPPNIPHNQYFPYDYGLPSPGVVPHLLPFSIQHRMDTTLTRNCSSSTIYLYDGCHGFNYCYCRYKSCSIIVIALKF